MMLYSITFIGDKNICYYYYKNNNFIIQSTKQIIDNIEEKRFSKEFDVCQWNRCREMN